MDMNVESSTQKSKKRLGIIIAVIAVLLVVALGVYFIVSSKPKNIFLKNINNEYEKFSSLFVEINDKDIKKATTSMEFDFNVNVSELLKPELSEEEVQLIDEINALKFKLDAGADLDKKLLSLVMNVKYNEDGLINVGAYGKPSSIYVSLEDIYDKYIEIPVEEYETLFDEDAVNTKDLEYLTSKIKDAFLNSLDENHFEKSSEKISVNGKDIKATKITYILTEERMFNIGISILKELREDSKFLEILSSLYDVTQDEIKSEIDGMIAEFNSELEDVDNESEIEFSMYTKGIKNEAIKYLIKSGDAEISYTNYQDKIKLVFKDSEETYLTLTNDKNDDDSYKTQITMSTIEMTINSKEENDAWTHEYKMTESESMMEISGALTLKTEEVKKDKEYDEDFKFTMSMGVSGIQVIGMNLTAKAITKYNEEIIIPDVSNSILYTDLTEEDTNNMLSNIMNNQTLVNFITKISELTADDSYDYEEDYYGSYDYEEL